MNQLTLRVLDIEPGTSVDGPGLRTSIYFAGCDHHCPGCHNPDSWNHEGGKLMTIGEIMDVVKENGFNVTFSGGDPICQLHNVSLLAEEIAKEGLTLWVYTGFTFEQLLTMDNIGRLLSNTEVVVDGRFVKSLRDISLHFRGSSNQRLIDVTRSLENGGIVEADY